MKNAFRLLSIAALAGCTLLVISSCSDDYDDSELKDRLDKVEDRVTELEEWCATVNSEISSLKGLITALEGNDYVTGVETLEDGYKITFSKSGSIIIRNGKDGIDGEDGKDGYTPIIGVAKYSDGLYYWTIQTEDGKTNWLTDAEGNMIRTTGDNGKDGEDGEDGNDGLTPHIGENGNWWIGDTDTGIKAQGETGNDGLTPHIGENGNWWIGNTDTGVKAQGETGNNGNNAPTPIIKTGAELGNGYTANAVYLSVDGGNEWFKISGDKGEQGIQGPIGPAGPSGAACGISDIKIEDNKVIFTLGTGSTAEKFTVPFHTPILTITGQDKITEDNNTFTITSDIFNRNNLIIQTRVESNTADGTDITTRLISNRWNVENSVSNNTLTVKVTPPSTVPLNEVVLLKITVTSEAGELLASGQKVFTNGIFTGILSFYKQGDVSNQIKELDQSTKAGITSLKIIGNGEEFNDWDAMCIRDLENLETLDLSESKIKALFEMPDFSFPWLTKIKKLLLPRTITEIPGTYYFDEHALEEISAPGVTKIGGYAFQDCKSLQIVYFPKVETLGSAVFQGCTSLETIALPKARSFDEHANQIFQGCTALREVSMPELIALPSQSCFYGCMALEKIHMPKVTNIPHSTFYNCTSLQEINCPEVEEVGYSAFSNCKSITEIYLPKAVTIEDYAFSGQFDKLKSLTLGAVSSVGYGATDIDDDDAIKCDLIFTGEPTAGNLNMSSNYWNKTTWKSIAILSN